MDWHYGQEDALVGLEPDFRIEPDVELDFEVNRRSRSYKRWVQRSLNQVMGAGLAVDGIIGRNSRRAIRQFQRRHGLSVDGIVGKNTEAALLRAGASPPPGYSRTPTRPRPAGTPSLADLGRFTRRYVRDMIAAGTRIDCADLAIEVWIRFGERYGVPVSFRIWDARRKRWQDVTRRGIRIGSSTIRRFRSTAQFVRYVQGYLGAVGLVGNTFEVPGGHRASVAGDVFLWRYYHQRSGRRHRIGHTQLVDRVERSPRGARHDRVRIVQGNLPPTVPVFRTRPASYFTTPRAATIGGEPHTGRPVSAGPRRFNSFRHLR